MLIRDVVPRIHPRRVDRRAIVIGGFVVLLALLITRGRREPDLQWRLAVVSGPDSFDLIQWEAVTLARRVRTTLFPSVTPADPVATVIDYFALTDRVNQLTGQRDQLWARRSTDASVGAQLDAVQKQLDLVEQRRASLRPIVERVISAQVDDQLARDGVRPAFISFHPIGTFPFEQPWVVPNVFFGLGDLPELLVVAPRDRVAIVGSVLLHGNLSTQAVDQLETSTDRLGVASLVITIGGLAAYPSMIPDTEALEPTLITISHEWTHHYLALHPLGWSYFSGYEMTSINETVADMVGHEVGTEVYNRYYKARLEPQKPTPTAPTAPAPQPTAPARPDFGTLMRAIRKNVEADLARGDVAAADAYMADQQRELAKEGYYVRRLNTAYLAFFGSYAGGANPFEPLLRAVRQRSADLPTFLATIQNIQTPDDLRRLAGSG